MQGPHDEVRALAETFDAMLDRIQESFDSERRLTANMSHELRTPLTTQRAFIELAFEEDGVTMDEKQRVGELALDQNRRATGIIEGMLVLARASSEMEKEHELLPLAPMVEGVCAGEAERAAKSGIDLSSELGQEHFIHAHPVLVERLIHNLVNNAIVHNEPGGWARITISADGSRIRLAVENSGPVLTPEAVEQIRVPFRRGDNDRTRSQDGHGLGLTIVQAIADFHDAELSIQPREQGGLIVKVTFPDPGIVRASLDHDTSS